MIVLTASSAEYAPLNQITMLSKIDWARRYAHEFIFEEHTENNRGRMAWERVEIWQKWLKACGWLFFTGADAAITQPNGTISLPTEDFDLFVACDGNGLQSDSFLMRNCQETRQFLDDVLACEGVVGNEQVAMNLVLAGYGAPRNGEHLWPGLQSELGPFSPLWPSPGQIERTQKALSRSPVRVKILAPKVLNAYPAECYPGYLDEHGHGWEPGCFVAHIPAREMDVRMNWFRKTLRGTV